MNKVAPQEGKFEADLSVGGHENSGFSADEETLQRLGKLDLLEYERCRENEAHNLGVRIGVLDDLVCNRRPDRKKPANGNSLSLQELEPWREPVDGSELLADLVGAFSRHLALDHGAAEAMALWTMHTHVFNSFQISPRLAITSPEKRCGKTTALILLSCLVPKPLPTVNITASALFRSVEAAQPTLLIDEGDTFLKGKDELGGILNSGHNKAMAFVVRNVGDDHEPRIFPTWTPIVIALIGKLSGTLEDRSVMIKMRRRRKDELVEPLRLDRTGHLDELARKCARWAADNEFSLRAADPDIPDGLHDRAADNWRPLLAIADQAGGIWPDFARSIVVKIVRFEDDETSDASQLLADIHQIFEVQNIHQIPSVELCDLLGDMEDRPWPEMRNGKVITPRQLSRLLSPFNIRPKTIRAGRGKTPKGYKLDDFADAFSRYINDTSATTPQPWETPEYSGFQSATPIQDVADKNDTFLNEINGVADVADIGNDTPVISEPLPWDQEDCDPIWITD